jgi:hypothetical protein
MFLQFVNRFRDERGHVVIALLVAGYRGVA